MTKRRPEKRARAPHRPTAVLFVGDLHVGSRVALAPKPHRANETQAALGRAWDEMLGRAAKLAQGHRLVLALGGDLVEGFHHGSTEVWAADEDEMRAAALGLLAPLTARADRVIAVTGTEAHAGRLGQDDRVIARELGATILRPGQDVMVGGRWLDWQHHGGRVGSLPWTMEDGMRGIAKTAHWSAVEEHVVPPALVMRHHLHQMPPAALYRETWAAVCGCWQGVTAFGARCGHKTTGVGCWVWHPDPNTLTAWRWHVPVSRLEIQ